MKAFKFIIGLFLILSAFCVKAQNEDNYDVYLDNEIMTQYRGTAVDTLGAGKTTWTFTVFAANQIDTKEKLTQYWEINLDSISGTAAATSVAFQTRKSIFSAWTSDSTVNWYGTSADTTIKFYDTTPRPDPYRRVKVTYGSGFKTKVDWITGLFLIE